MKDAMQRLSDNPNAPGTFAALDRAYFLPNVELR
jgi:hypothetical protein